MTVHRLLRTALVIPFLLLLAHPAPALASKTEKIEQLVARHDLRLSVATGRYYLRQQALLELRSLLAELGREQGLGPGWNREDPDWQRLEAAYLERLTALLDARFARLDWLSAQWSELDAREFSEADIDRLLAHFSTPDGRKQVMIVDHGVAGHVQGALSFTGRLVYDVPGLEADRSRMQQIFDEEDAAMRFRIEESPEGTRFAVSALGKRYFVNAMLNVSGFVTRRIDETAVAVREAARALRPEAAQALAALQRAGRS